MRSGERIADLCPNLQRLCDWQRSPGQPLRERLALEVLQDEKVDARVGADIVERADVWMTQTRNASRFAFEPLLRTGIMGDMLGQDFDGDRSCKPGVGRFIDF